MKIAQIMGRAVCGSALAISLAGCGGDAQRLRQENEALRAEIENLKARANAETEAQAARARDLQRLQVEIQDLAKLRGEVTQLRTTARDASKLRAENQQLKSENQSLRGANAAAATPATPAPEPGNFPKDSWTFAGYTSPDAALVSAIWSMQQGNPKQYFDSLTPEEQLRMTKVWEGKSQEEIAAKHQSDTAKITGMKILNQQAVSADEVVMSVYIGGVDRTEKVSMKRVGDGWKFGGFIREPAKP